MRWRILALKCDHRGRHLLPRSWVIFLLCLFPWWLCLFLWVHCRLFVFPQCGLDHRTRSCSAWCPRLWCSHCLLRVCWVHSLIGRRILFLGFLFQFHPVRIFTENLLDFLMFIYKSYHGLSEGLPIIWIADLHYLELKYQ